MGSALTNAPVVGVLNALVGSPTQGKKNQKAIEPNIYRGSVLRYQDVTSENSVGMRLKPRLPSGGQWPHEIAAVCPRLGGVISASS